MRYYIAYGSNLNVGHMEDRCPTAKAIGMAWLEGYELEFGGACLTIREKAGARTPVGVWAVKPEDEKNLDFYEGYPIYYDKQDGIKLDVCMRGGKRTVTAFVYIMRDNMRIGWPQRSYIETCEEGYEDFGLDKTYLRDAIERSNYYGD